MKDAAGAMRLMIPKWVPRAAKVALNEAWNEDLDAKRRALVRRLAINPAMHDVWLKLPAEPAQGAEWVVRSALWYASSNTFALRYTPIGPNGPMPWSRIHAQFILATMRAMAPFYGAEEMWDRVRGDDLALDFKAALAIAEKLPQFYAWWDRWYARAFDALPTVAKPQSQGARLQFFCKGMERQLRLAYHRPFYPVIAILARVVFALPQPLASGTVKKMCLRNKR